MVERLDDTTGTDNDDLLADLLGSDDDGTGSLPTNEDIKGLNDQIKELDKEKQGLLTATKEERRKRQEVSAKLNQLTDTVNNMLSQRQQQGTESLTESESADAQKKGIPVTYDSDGNAWVDQDQINNIVSPYAQKIQDLEQQLQLTNENAVASEAAAKVKAGIIGENELYESASSRYRAARKWVEDQVSSFASANGAQRNLTSGEALDYVFDDTLTKEFEETFEGMDIIDVVTAEDSQTNFRRTLDNIASIDKDDTTTLTTQPKEKVDSRFQKVLKKPSSLGNQTNSKAGQLSVIERVGNLGSQDIMDLSDEQVATLKKAMERGD